ncbi:uncharacterized protein V1513DRAFT_269074 [Lipomyces chichibuensis]|uniref:uncharacterized protein n=1 Tax=Lipomyces chichibuensis TaxID=1546026 RepID=UPI0033442EB3
MPDLEKSNSATTARGLTQREATAIAIDGVAVADSAASTRSRGHLSSNKSINYGQQHHLQQPMSQRRHTFSHGCMSRSAPSTPILGTYGQQGHGGGYFRGYTMTPTASSWTLASPSIPSSASSRPIPPRRGESSSPTSVMQSSSCGLSRSPSPTNYISTNESTHIAPPKSSGGNGFALSSCQYETALINARRRIPYSLGTSPLPPMPASIIKETLSVEGEAILTTDTEKLFRELLPSDDNACRRRKFIAKLERLLNEEWPGHDIRVHPFGSTENLLCSNDSDVDVCISTSWRRLENTCMLANFWANHKMERVVCVPGAKVPIVKIWDPEYDVACDMNVNNTLALENTKMVKTYVQIDWRVRPLAMIIKHWTKQRELNDAAGGGTLSSYSWICLIINFLQLRTPPILPILHQIGTGSRPEKVVNGVDISFCDDLEHFAGYGEINKESIGQLLFEFFKWYAYDFDYDRHVVSVRHGRLLSKSEKGWDTLQNNRFCIEEPLVTSRNLGNTVDDISAKGILQEFRRAYGILSSEANLGKFLKRFDFPQDDNPHAIREDGLGLILGSGTGRRITRSVSSSGNSSSRSLGGRPYSGGGFYRSQSHRKGSNGTYQGRRIMAPGGVYPPPMFKLPAEYGMMPIYSVSPEGYPFTIASLPPIAKLGNTSSAEALCSNERIKPSKSAASAQFGYIIPAYFPSPRFPLYYQPAYEDAHANEASNQSGSDASETRSGRARSLSPSRQSTRLRHHHQMQQNHDASYPQSQRQESKRGKSYAYQNSKGNALSRSRSEYLPQSSESGSDLSDISPDVPPHAYPPITPPDCRLDDFVNDAGDDYDLKFSSLHISHSDEVDVLVVDDEDGGMTTDSEGTTFVAQKELVDRMQGMGRPGYTSPPASMLSSIPLPKPLSVSTNSTYSRSYSTESEDSRREPNGPVIVNGDLSSLVPRSIGLIEDSHSQELASSRSGSKSYADVLMDQRIFPSKTVARSASEDSSPNVIGNVRYSNEMSEPLDSLLAEFGKNQLNRTSGMRGQNHEVRNLQHEDDEYWAVSGGPLASNHNEYLATHMPLPSATTPVPVKNGGMSYSAAAAASNVQAGSTKSRPSLIANGSIGSSSSVTVKQNQWTTSTSKRSRKKKNVKKEDSVGSMLISAELIKGG